MKNDFSRCDYEMNKNFGKLELIKKEVWGKSNYHIKKYFGVDITFKFNELQLIFQIIKDGED